MGISLIDSYICITNLFNMYNWLSNLIQDLRNFLPGGPNRKYIASFLFLFIWMALFDKNRWICLLYTSPSPRDRTRSRMPSSA